MEKAQLYRLILKRLIASIISMIKSLFLALPLGILVGTMSLYVMKTYEKRKKIIIKKGKRVAISLFLSYIVIMIQMAILFRPFGTIREIDLIPFNMPGGLRYIVLYVLANAIVFLPIGIFIPMIWDKIINAKKVLLVGFFMSLFIEISQLALQCGVFQTEDLIANTLGAGIGYYIYKKYKIKSKNP